MPWRSSICDCRYSGNETANLLTSTCAIIASVAMPPSIRPFRRRGHHHGAFTGPAGVARTAGDAHPQVRRHDVELLAALFVDHVQHTAAAGAVARRDVDQHLIAR